MQVNLKKKMFLFSSETLSRLNTKGCRRFSSKYTGFYTHPSSWMHEMGAKHPETPGRLDSILHKIKEYESSTSWHKKLLKIESKRVATAEEIALVHTSKHEAILNDLFHRSEKSQQKIRLDEDTLVCPNTRLAALHAAGSVCSAVDAVLSPTNEVQNAFVAVRPPGHHAEPEKPMGFCFYNNVAIGSAYAIKKYQKKRVAIVDFDVHHGNGTEKFADGNENVHFISTHQGFGFYPNSGDSSYGGKLNNILNIPFESNTDGPTFRRRCADQVFSRLDKIEPDLIMISAGMQLDVNYKAIQTLIDRTDDFAWMMDNLCRISAKFCKGEIVAVLEGGYDLDGLAASVAVTLKS